MPAFVRPRSQVVRQRSAKPRFGGSNPPGASTESRIENGPRERPVFFPAAPHGGRIHISWPLLAWSALVAALLSSGFGRALRRAQIRSARERGREAAPHVLRRAARRARRDLLFALLLWPLLYGAAFEWLGHAEAGTGFLLGVAHALFTLGRYWPRRKASGTAGAAYWREQLGPAFVRLFYGTLLGYLYVVPGG